LHHPDKNGGQQLNVFAERINEFGASTLVYDYAYRNAGYHGGKDISGEFIFFHSVENRYKGAK
jgi:hypothetical protein